MYISYMYRWLYTFMCICINIYIYIAESKYVHMHCQNSTHEAVRLHYISEFHNMLVLNRSKQLIQISPES